MKATKTNSSLISLNGFYCDLLPQEPLLGINIRNGMVELKNEEEWINRPIFKIEFGFIFFTLSYTKITFSEE